MDEDVIRFLNVRVDALEKGPSIMMKKRRGGGIKWQFVQQFIVKNLTH